MPRKAAPEPAETPVEAPQVHTVTNDVKGRTLHLGDGRKLAFGESAQVSAEVAALMGQPE